MLRRFASIFVTLLLAVAAAAQQRITVNVACNQGICEGSHTFTVTVTDNATPANTHEVTVSVPEFTGSKAIADALAAKFNDLPNLCDKFKTDEVDRPSGNKPGAGGPSADDKLKRHDLIIPACLNFKSCAHTRNGRPTNTGQVTIEPAKERKLSASTPITLELNIAGCAPGSQLEVGVFGSVVADADSKGTFAFLGADQHPLQGVGDWLADTFGAIVTYPSATSLQATIAASYDISFCYAAAGEIASDDPSLTYQDALAFDVSYGQ